MAIAIIIIASKSERIKPLAQAAGSDALTEAQSALRALEHRLQGMRGQYNQLNRLLTSTLEEYRPLREAREAGKLRSFHPEYQRYKALQERIYGFTSEITRKGKKYAQYIPGLLSEQREMARQINKVEEEISRLSKYIAKLKSLGGRFAALWARCLRVGARAAVIVILPFEITIGYFNVVEVFNEHKDWKLTAELFKLKIKDDDDLVKKINDYCNNDNDCISATTERIAKAMASRFFIEERKGKNPTIDEIYNDTRQELLGNR